MLDTNLRKLKAASHYGCPSREAMGVTNQIARNQECINLIGQSHDLSTWMVQCEATLSIHYGCTKTPISTLELEDALEQAQV